MANVLMFLRSAPTEYISLKFVLESAAAINVNLLLASVFT